MAQRVRHGRSAKTELFSTYTRQVAAGCRALVDPVADDFPQDTRYPYHLDQQASSIL